MHIRQEASHCSKSLVGLRNIARYGKMDVGKIEMKLLNGVEKHVCVVRNFSAIESIAEFKLIVFYGGHSHAVVSEGNVDVLIRRN